VVIRDVHHFGEDQLTHRGLARIRARIFADRFLGHFEQPSPETTEVRCDERVLNDVWRKLRVPSALIRAFIRVCPR
jgi:hypothetical protein